MEEALRKILPVCVAGAVSSKLNYEKLYEIRLRADKYVTLNYGGKIYFLSANGLCQMSQNALKTCARMVHDTVVRATDYSLYAVNDQLKNGFLTIRGGVRVGVAGEMVREGGEVKTLKNFSGINTLQE